jgi:2-polyprenyl-6-methoxyphenol hydroxylase-like FAD-dependent oxidoreductase
MNNITNKVVIVGGGPVGLTLSLILARYNVSSLILEKRKEATPLDESRAITWMPRGLELLNWLGIYEKFHEKGVFRTFHQFRNQHRELLVLPFTTLQTPYSYSLQLPQHETETILEKAALETGLVEIRRGHEVIDIGQTEESVMVKVQYEDESYKIYAPFGVGCDGSKTMVREKLEIEKNWRDFGLNSGVADFELNCDLPKDVSNIILDPERPYGFFYFAPQRWRLIYRINKGEDREKASSFEFVRGLLNEKLPNVKIKRILWVSAFRLGEGQSNKYHKGRWVLAGDSAHAMGPSAGAGMMVGVLGAWRLGWRLALSVNKQHNLTRLLQDYSREQKVGADEIQDNNAIIFRNMAISNPILATGRSIILKFLGYIPLFKKKTIEKDALLNQILPVFGAVDQYVSKSASNLKSYGKWILGKRMPYISNEEGSHPLEQNTTKHMFISIGKYHPKCEQKYFKSLCQDSEYPICKEFLHIGADSKYRKDGRDFVFALVRPDQHIVSILKLS